MGYVISKLKAVRRRYLKKRAEFDAWKIRYSRESKLRRRSAIRKLQRILRSPFRRRPAIFIGPTNSANQGTLWSRALRTVGIDAESLRISEDIANEWFTSDFALTRTSWLEFAERQKLADHIASTKDVVLIESLRPMFRLANDRDGRNQVIEDLEMLRMMKKKIGIIFHGSDIRDTNAHASRNPFSPFHNENPEIERLQARTEENRKLLPMLREWHIPLFVTTKDLLADLPDAHWFPVTIDFEAFHRVAVSSPIFPDSTRKLRVMYLPSRSWLKSADVIEPILIKLRDEGVIEYNSYLSSGTSLKHSEIPDAISQVDLVIDQFLGVVGVFPLEALAAGRLVMSYIPAEVGEVPIINITPDTLESELRRVAIERPLPHTGVEYARQWHDGRESTLALAEVFGFRL